MALTAGDEKGQGAGQRRVRVGKQTAAPGGAASLRRVGALLCRDRTLPAQRAFGQGEGHGD